jgi:glycerol-3-phosphate acyltransferase PlsX
MALVSAGSTGAVLTGGVLLLKRIRGIQRPALSPILPTLTGGNVMLIDCGANVEPKARNLVEFAQMGAVYMQKVYNIDNPRIALLSNGTEDSKGNTLNKEVFPLLKESQLNFIGNMEAREILSGDYDVVVADGFSGNIALKACEGTALSMFSLIKKGIMSGSLRAKLGYLLLKPVLKDIKKTLDYNDNGGAVLLGLEKVLVKSHGSSKAKAICNSILQARDLVASGVLEKLKEEFTVAK